MKIRWGILGAGNIAAKWASDLSLAGNAKLGLVWARDPAKAEAFARQYGAQNFTGSLEQLLDSPEVDAIYVATPNGLHSENTNSCLNAGKPVLVEKPFALDLASTESTVLSARSNDIFCMEALWTRFLPSFQNVLNIVHSGRIGQVRHLKANFGFCADKNSLPRLWDPGMGGGSLLDIGVYPLFLARAILGDPENILASMTRSNTGVDSSCLMKLSWVDGVSAELSCTFLDNTSCQAIIEGDFGRIVMESMFHCPCVVVVKDRQGTERFQPMPGGHGYQHQIRHFGDCLRRCLKESPLWSLSDTLALALLVERVRVAAAPRQ